RESDDRVRIPHVDPLRIRSWRIEVNSEGAVQVRGKHLHFFGFPCAGDAAKNPDVTGLAFGHEKITVGSRANQTWTIEPSGVLFNLEPRLDLWPSIVRARHKFWPVARRFGREWRWKILRSDLADGARLFEAVVRKGWFWYGSSRLAGADRSAVGITSAGGHHLSASKRFHIGD